MSERPYPNPLNRPRVWLRRVLVRLAAPALRMNLSDPVGGLDRLTALNREGVGVILLMNHFALRDPLQALAVLFRSPVLITRPILAPVAYHQVLQYGRFGRFITWILGIEVMPVVTADTIRILKSRPHGGTGLAEYFAAGAAALAAGEIVLLAPQGARTSRLGRPHGRPIARLLAVLAETEVPRFALGFIGFSLPDAINYSRERVGGLNIGRLYEIRVGQTVTSAELDGVREPQEAVDVWAFARLAELLPAAYTGAGETDSQN